ncbi:WD repeat-containing protein 44 [Geosmithia morbida]|uniref:WD repeat-containing protein 44 n=1 Tax=Geosmithia morbida TaxID=1094350 RepID=A0A9P5CYW3_9HYPO|nr:WD repeat-containing protein 44 [Geosmithia morbida]KAF4119822.1 WD repeat-containing protein 44 [Geosmithia morbida]
MPPSPPANLAGDGDMTDSKSHSAQGAVIPGAQPEPQQSPSPDGADTRPSPDAPTPALARLTRTSTQLSVKDKESKVQLRPTPSNHSASVGLDPLSTQIYLRTNNNTEHTPSIAQRLRSSGRPEGTNAEGPGSQAADTSTRPPQNRVVDATREWRRGSSFLSRLSMRPPWARDDDDPDSDSEMGEPRENGTSARAFTSFIGDGGGYIPSFKDPPRYIHVKTRNKKTKEFNRMFLAQELTVGNSDDEGESQGRAPATAIGKKILKGSSAAIWTAEFSLDGRYLAIGGKDNMVRIYAVISTHEDRRAQEEDEELNHAGSEKLSAPVFRDKPVHEFTGHTGEVLALSWSKNGFLLSSSMDKTVKLWHPQRPECLATFVHNDLVTSIAFHPTDDRFFLAGSLDAQLRLWSITEKSVPYSAETSEFITAVGFTPDGKTAICGSLSGMCTFYNTEGLEAQYQIHVRSSRGKNAKGSKITGIQTIQVQHGSDKGDVKVLISSNDSRVRIYNMRTRMLENKFRGHVNQSSQIHARFSEGGEYVVCGSEDRKAYIWSPDNTDAEARDKRPYEYFDAHPEVVTVVVMAPIKSRQLLSGSGDPIYDLCNPPPVMLVSLDENQVNTSDAGRSELSKHGISGKKPEESPAYIERSKHLDGNIIVTADRTGTIKVFRQDCGFNKRQQHMWETGSKLSGKLAAGVGRSSSIRTRTSRNSRVQSRRESLNISQSPMLPQMASDRIMSWRQDVDGGFRPSRNATPTRSERSASPTKAAQTSTNTSAVHLARDSVNSPHSTPPSKKSPHTSPRSSTHTNRTGRGVLPDKGRMSPPLPSFNFLSISDPKDGKSESGI